MFKKYFSLTRDIIRNPKTFLDSIRQDKGIKKPFHFLTLFTLIVFVFLTYFYLNQMNLILVKIANIFDFAPIVIPKSVEIFIIAYICFVALYIVIAFLRYYIIHFCAFLLGAQNKYYQTYKALTYSLAPEYLSTPLFVVLIALTPTMILSRTPLLIALFVLFLIPYMIIFFYTIYLRILALSYLQKISMAKSFVSIYILGFFGQIIALIIIEFVLIIIAVVIRSIF